VRVALGSFSSWADLKFESSNLNFWERKLPPGSTPSLLHLPKLRLQSTSTQFDITKRAANDNNIAARGVILEERKEQCWLEVGIGVSPLFEGAQRSLSSSCRHLSTLPTSRL
jgi:hypothetical protein